MFNLSSSKIDFHHQADLGGWGRWRGLMKAAMLLSKELENSNSHVDARVNEHKAHEKSHDERKRGTKQEKGQWRGPACLPGLKEEEEGEKGTLAIEWWCQRWPDPIDTPRHLCVRSSSYSETPTHVLMITPSTPLLFFLRHARIIPESFITHRFLLIPSYIATLRRGV